MSESIQEMHTVLINEIFDIIKHIQQRILAIERRLPEPPND